MRTPSPSSSPAAARLFHDANPDAEPLCALACGPDGAEARKTRWAAALAPGRRLSHASLCAPAWGAYEWVAVIDEADDSQFDRLLAELRAGGAVSSAGVAFALAGKRFHGYRGRPWTALRGNLHLSAVFPVHRELGPAATALSAIPAVAVLDALEPWKSAGFNPGIKWVNDIVWQGRKISGVITATQGRGVVTEAVVFGIGLNVAVAPAVEPSVFVPASGCLADALGNDTPGLGGVFEAVAAALAGRLRQFLEEGARPIVRAYRAGSMLMGREVRVWDEATVNDFEEVRRHPAARRGVVEDVLDDLSLRLSGDPEPVTRGRLALESTCRNLGL